MYLSKTNKQYKRFAWFTANQLTELGLNDMSTFFVVSQRGRGERKMNENEETEEIKTSPPIPLSATRTAGLALL